MAKKKKIVLNNGHWHEATDRTYCVIDIIQSILLDHPVISQTPQLKKQVLKAQEILRGVYLKAGAKL